VPSSSTEPLRKALHRWWRENATEMGAVATTSLLLRNLWSFARDSTPERRRQRYGDMEYDWENRVNTTSGTVGWRARLLGLFHSPYQPTDPTLFREMMANLPIDFSQFTFIDIGSGKGRTLLLASEYPFQKIVGVELIQELHSAAEENIRAYHSATQRCTEIEAVFMDACEFGFPQTPLVLYLFNPLPEAGLRRVTANLDQSLSAHLRTVYVLYHNPLLDRVVSASARLTKTAGTKQYSTYVFTSE
jgi:SAM-dependent methyltransferase